MKHIFKLSNAIIAGLLALLGFASCVENAPNEYGTPSAKYRINGRVTAAESNQPVREIKVVMREDSHWGLDGEPLWYSLDSAWTDASGNYHVVANTISIDEAAFQLEFSDTDGDANGAYRDTTVTVVFTDPVFTGGDGHWYKGEATQELDIALTELTPN
ncbi:MAG: radical SAM-associated putative lipoprotein [Prevotellaceae bacterium]|jgi:putative lipoprotein (rSAM/lipoprotein system)|nr:radical SAM-associated putative lipoprotein [Prevotellaceae bacterium]